MKNFYLSIGALALVSTLQAQNAASPADTAKKSMAVADTARKVAAPVMNGIDADAVNFSKNITAQDLSTYLHRLASDEFEGRETGQPGQQKAGEYIANQFAAMGIPSLPTGGYFQQIPLTLKKAGSSTFTVNSQNFTFLKDYYYFANEKENVVSVYGKITFAGYGISDDTYNDYKGLGKNGGRTILILGNEPHDEKGNSLITKEKGNSMWAQDIRKKIAAANEYFEKLDSTKITPSTVLIVVDSVQQDVDKMGHYITSPSMGFTQNKATVESGKKSKATFIFISKSMANAILQGGGTSIAELEAKISKSGKPYNKEISTQLRYEIKREKQAVTAQNVLGYIEGTDLKNELVVVTGHYDHLGKDGNTIFYGADDDGSGTSAVMEMAKAFAIAKKSGKGPRRSMLFMTVSGEEKGLLGSEYYSEHPVFPLENTVADLNIDMIGRLDEKHPNNPNYVYVIGSDKLSTQLHAISENANKTYSKLELDYTYNDPKDPNRFYFRSDHYNFAKHNIPVIFYFNGVHADYHKSTDTVEKIDFFKMEKITRLVFFTAWDLANRNERIKVDVTNAFGNK